MSIYGKPITLGGGGGVRLISRAAWNALSYEEKTALGLLAIEDADSGYHRGVLVYGGDYEPVELLQSGTARYSADFTAESAGALQLFVLALNSEASTFALTLDVTRNGAALGGETLDYHAYASTGANRRNYRLMRFGALGAGDAVHIALSACGDYASFVWALMRTPCTAFVKAASTADAICSGSCAESGMALSGTFAGAAGGTLEAAAYDANAVVTTADPGRSYKSAYVFWLKKPAEA